MLSHNCKKCSLHKISKYVCIEGKGNSTNPKIIMIGEAPGPDEALKGEIFVGKAGQKLIQMIKPLEGQYYLTNIVKCRPASPTDDAGKFRTPTDEEIALCKPLFIKELHQIAARNPEVIPILMPLGNTALTGLIGSHKGITKELGISRQVKIGFKEYTVIPNFHPSYVCRNPEAEKPFTNIILTTAAILRP